ncbi:RNase A-like domain-containing protein [Mannheimia indoligenes]|uniref:RNase A-like domain-containing protein n=1 Tax=Mannheimia indoligenes TaxID=3103145 RepID=UPI002FE54F31
MQLKAEAQAIEAEYGLGSNLQMGIRAATAALQGLATGNANQAAVGLLSPYANKLIKEQTTNADGTVNTEANLMAHAVLGAIEAYATGNNAAAGALGALTAEAAAPYLMQALYNTDKAENLTDSQKQNIANLSQIAAGLAGGVTGDSTADFISGAEIGKRAVENNSLVVDRLRENKKADAEQWKLKIREKLGNNTASQFVNGVIGVVEEGADSALFVGDTVFDAFALLATCAVGDSYCNQAKTDLAGKNQAVSNALNALMTGEYWENIKIVAQQAYQGDQEALENFAGVLTGLVLPTKVLPNNSKLSNFSKNIPSDVNYNNKAPIIGKISDYELIDFKSNVGGTLIYHENIGGHTISKHVGKQDIELANRLNSEPNLRMASSFTDIQTAEKAISTIVYNNSNLLSEFMVSSQNRLALAGDVGFSVGRIMDRTSSSSTISSKATVIIVKDSLESKGWRILTAFPDK